MISHQRLSTGHVSSNAQVSEHLADTLAQQHLSCFTVFAQHLIRHLTQLTLLLASHAHRHGNTHSCTIIDVYPGMVGYGESQREWVLDVSEMGL